MRSLLTLTFALAVAAPPEPPPIAASPREAAQLDLPAGEEVVDYRMSLRGPEVALLVKGADGRKLLAWRIGEPQAKLVWKADAAISPRALAWHPRERRWFVLAEHDIYAVAESGEARVIHHSEAPMSRLIISPRPFNAYNYPVGHRLFFGVERAKDKFDLHSVTEQGDHEYQVIGARRVALPEEEVQPSELLSESALPLGFHPAGHYLLWQDAQGCAQAAEYDRRVWGKSAPLRAPAICTGSVAFTSNGAGYLHWDPGRDGLTLYFNRAKTGTALAGDVRFLLPPALVADGRGLVGLVRGANGQSLRYLLTDIPLADVANAWMFLASPQDEAALVKNGGALRKLLHDDQLYSLYDSELYLCGDYDHSVPTRPYLVTTDVFWELFAAAFQGVFILDERQRAIPAFRAFVDQINSYYAATPASGSPWPETFAAIREVLAGAPKSAAALVIAAGEGELKPRGHYTADADLSAYFKAVHYLTSLDGKHAAKIAELGTVPDEVKKAALAWIDTYRPFISQPGRPLIWDSERYKVAPWATHPGESASLFPLSYAFDNEILDSVVFHEGQPEAERMAGPAGPRLVPSGLDVAAGSGSAFALALLKESGELEKYPPLAAALRRLAERYRQLKLAPAGASNLYDAWIGAIGAQWADGVAPPDPAAAKLWQTKRLQTGLASWATLRHATVLVNQRTAAECGEAGFEELLTEPPRGYVEPDPAVFEAIAGLLDELANHVTAGAVVRDGVLRRLAETAAAARRFAGIARKQLAGEPRDEKEYDDILHVGRAAEHNFLIFKSLASKDFALSTPDPVQKIVDVAGGGRVPYLLSAVGVPLEWDQIVPHFSGRQIVKGVTYSYHELVSDKPMSDAEWRAQVKKAPLPEWVAPYLSESKLRCPAPKPF